MDETEPGGDTRPPQPCQAAAFHAVLTGMACDVAHVLHDDLRPALRFIGLLAHFSPELDVAPLRLPVAVLPHAARIGKHAALSP